MKKLIITLFICVLSALNCFGDNLYELQGKWCVVSKETNEQICYSFSKDTLYIDSYIDNQLNEGDVYTIKIHKDIISVYYAYDTPYNKKGDKVDFYIKVLSDFGDDNLTFVLINKNDNTKDRFTLVRKNNI